MKLILNFIFGLYCLGRLVSMIPLDRTPMEEDAPNVVINRASALGTIAPPSPTTSGKEAFNLFNYLELIGVVMLFFSMAMRKKRSNIVVQDPTNPMVVDTTPI
ncbi:MAG: hypothetical protein R3E32_21010 [Chitinophagales bacterium]